MVQEGNRRPKLVLFLLRLGIVLDKVRASAVSDGLLSLSH